MRFFYPAPRSGAQSIGKRLNLLGGIDMKRFAVLIIALILAVGVISQADAAGSEAENAANRLYELGLLAGTKADGTPEFDLEGELNREQAVTMLVRLLGKEEEARKGGWKMPFTDVSGWARDYVGYAYEKGLAKGTGATTFRGTDPVTASQYVTFVLRALGYSTDTDFAWNAPWPLSDSIGLTKGQYTEENNGSFIRADMAVISAAALDTAVKGGEGTLLESLEASARTGYTREDYIDRVLTDEQINALKGASLEELREKISTIGDAVAFLDKFTPRNYSGFSGEIRLDIDFLFDLHTRSEATTPHTYSAFAAWCITDDFEGVKYVVSTSDVSLAFRVIPQLALPVQGGYYLCLPNDMSAVAERTGFIGTEVSSLDGLENSIVFPTSNWCLMQLFVADADQRTLKFVTDENAMEASLSVGSAELVYSISDSGKAEHEEQQQQQLIQNGWANLQRNWRGYGFPSSFDPTLTREEVEQLIGKDAQTVSSALKTVGDVLYYLALSGYHTTDGDIKVWENDLCWSFTEAPLTVFAHTAGNCGGTAALIPFLLEGDYTESGCLSMTGPVEVGGGHVITYIQDGADCYVIDFRAIVDMQYMWNGGSAKGADVVEAGRKWRDTIDPMYKLIFAYPTVEGDMPAMGNGKLVYLPEQYRDRIRIVYEATGEGYRFGWKSIGSASLKQIAALRTPPQMPDEEDIPKGEKQAYMTRLLTDGKLAELKYADKEVLRKYISTVADAVAWMDQFENVAFYDRLSDTEVRLNIDFVLELIRGERVTAPEAYTYFAAWCLSDDYPEAKFLLASGALRQATSQYSGLLLPKDGGYQVISPAQYSKTRNCVYGFDTKVVSDTKDLGTKLSLLHAGVDDRRELQLYQLISVPAGEAITLPKDGDFYSVRSGATELYRITSAETAAKREAEMAQWDKTAATLRIADYGLPAAIGKTTLSYAEAKALRGADPAAIADRVRTVGDVLQYMIAVRFSYYAPDAYTPWYGFWGFDAPGDVQLEQNYGCCCGGFANTVSYLLRGDYEKVGTLRWIGGGNHTISWVLTGGKYYVFDFTQLCNGGYYNDKTGHAVTVLDRLEDFYSKMPATYSYFPKSEIELMVAFEAADAAYPSNWNDPPGFTGLTFPTEAEGKVLVIYQKDSAHGMKYADVSGGIPGWND